MGQVRLERQLDTRQFTENGNTAINVRSRNLLRPAANTALRDTIKQVFCEHDGSNKSNLLWSLLAFFRGALRVTVPCQIRHFSPLKKEPCG